MSRYLQGQPSGVVMLIDDNVELCRAIGTYLEEEGFLVDYAHDGQHGLQIALHASYDAVIVDWSLPGMDGLQVCRSLRHKGRNMPILMLTGRGGVDPVIDALEAGADDYLHKPFAIAELRARIEALVRRHKQKVTPCVLSVAGLTLDTGTLEVTREGRRIVISPVGLRLLSILMAASPRVVPRAELERAIWGDTPPESDTLRSHLYVLRRAIDRPFQVPLLHTMQGIGFCLADRSSTVAA